MATRPPTRCHTVHHAASLRRHGEIESPCCRDSCTSPSLGERAGESRAGRSPRERRADVHPTPLLVSTALASRQGNASKDDLKKADSGRTQVDWVLYAPTFSSMVPTPLLLQGQLALLPVLAFKDSETLLTALPHPQQPRSFKELKPAK